ncbi:MAG: flavodoxin [Candidatus Margulisiibacteriota bacterium]
MKTLVVYYSKTGTTKKVAEVIAQELNADVEEIIDLKDRSGFFGFIFAGRDTLKKIPTRIKETIKNPADYDLIVLGSPLWGFKGASPAVRTYLQMNKDSIKDAAFFLTMGGTPGQKVFDDLTEVLGQVPVGVFEVKQDEVNKDSFQADARKFAVQLNTI